MDVKRDVDLYTREDYVYWIVTVADWPLDGTGDTDTYDRRKYNRCANVNFIHIKGTIQIVHWSIQG